MNKNYQIILEWFGTSKSKEEKIIDDPVLGKIKKTNSDIELASKYNGATIYISPPKINENTYKIFKILKSKIGSLIDICQKNLSDKHGKELEKDNINKSSFKLEAIHVYQDYDNMKKRIICRINFLSYQHGYTTSYNCNFNDKFQLSSSDVDAD